MDKLLLFKWQPVFEYLATFCAVFFSWSHVFMWEVWGLCPSFYANFKSENSAELFAQLKACLIYDIYGTHSLQTTADSLWWQPMSIFLSVQYVWLPITLSFFAGFSIYTWHPFQRTDWHQGEQRRVLRTMPSRWVITWNCMHVTLYFTVGF